MAKRILISAVPHIANQLAQAAARAALEDIAVALVSEAQSLAPVRQAFKNPKGQRHRTKAIPADLDVGMKGRGARMLVRRRDRNEYNRRSGGQDFIVGRTTHTRRRTGDEITNFKGVGGATAFQTEIGRAAARSGHGSRPKNATGYQLGAQFQPLLTSRARYNLARGIGVHRISGGSYSGAAAGTLVIGGALRDSIHVTDIESDGKNGLQFELRAEVRYAPYVEFGTYKDVAQPFMRPAIKNTKRAFRGKIKDHFQDFGFEVKG